MSSSPLSRRRFLRATGVAATPLALAWGGCGDEMRTVKPLAGPALDALIPLVARDTGQIREGLPKGVVALAKHLDDEPADNREGLRNAIVKARESTQELVVAKSTFFVFVGTDGVVKRSESDPDLAADQSLIEAVPAAKDMLDPKRKLVEVFGTMEGLRGVNKGNKLQWIVGAPVVIGGTLKGAFVTGFSLRRYAEVLEISLKAKLKELVEAERTMMPLFYNFIIKGDQAYGTAVAPDENMAAVGAARPLANLGPDGMFSATLEVEGRRFFVAAKPAPALAEDAAVAVMLSPV
ncbi:MAG: hypothetical protein AAGN82_25010 [Myxococcota bacterium]